MKRYLTDQALREQLVTPTEKGTLPETPFHRLCMLFGENTSTQWIPILVSFLNEPSPEIRKSVIILIASTGSETSVVPIRTSLRDDDEYVRSYALLGLRDSLHDKRLSDVCRKELFEDIKKLLAEGKNGNDAAALLFQFDEQRATTWFLSDTCLSPDFHCLHNVLQVLNAKNILVPRAKLLNSLDRLRAMDSEYPRMYELSEALHALGKHQIVKDRELLEEFLKHKDHRVAEGAAEGMLASHGLDDFRKRIGEARQMTAPQRRYVAVMMLDSEVCNGGFSQYFFNSSGDDWRDALAGLEAMESKERLTIFREVLAKFGAAGPSQNRDERMIQLSKIAKAEEALFDKLDSRYYGSTEVIDVMVMRYVLKNSKAFQ